MNTSTGPSRSVGPTLAFVFSGGASYAAAQAGMLRAVTAEGIRPDLVVGTSAGALNAVAFASDPTPGGVDNLVAAWTATRRSDVFPLRPASLALGLAGRRNHLIPPANFARWLDRHLSVRSLEDTVLPVRVVATDLASGDPVLLDRGPALPALMASSAVPGVFPPVTLQGRSLVDGGLASDTPIGAAVSSGATRVLVFPSHAPAELPRGDRSALALATYAYRQVFGHWTADQASVAPSVEVEILPVPSMPGSRPFDFSNSARLVDAADQLTRHWLVERSREAA